MSRACKPTWSDQPGACVYFGADPDGAYCGHPESLAVSAGFGCSIQRMVIENRCCESNDYKLWKGKDSEVSSDPTST